MQNQITQLINKFKEKGYEVEEATDNYDMENLVAAYYLECEDVLDYGMLFENCNLFIFQNGTCHLVDITFSDDDDDDDDRYSWKFSIQELLIMSWSDIFHNLLKQNIIRLVAMLEEYYGYWQFRIDDITHEFPIPDIVAVYHVVFEDGILELDIYEDEEDEEDEEDRADRADYYELMIFQDGTCRLKGESGNYNLYDMSYFVGDNPHILFLRSS